MIILGIDPGLAIVGYGVINVERGKSTVIDYGVITTPKEDKVPVRLRKIYEGMNALLDKFQPDNIALEELFFNTNTTTGINVAQARGVILLACTQRTNYLYEYTPLQVKQAMTGYGKAEKKQIQYMVTKMLNLSKIPKPDDAADALAIALTHAQAARFGGLFKI
ncbi:MAG: crossover junction endodeoxyribonuclease RuvC [Clostridiales bacterium]|nr:crossover junction endodeoxyribonuclease RuvC [Clostridiales bacterium]